MKGGDAKSMGKYKNIEDYRRKKRLSGFLKKLILLAVIAGILIVLLNVLEIFKGKDINEMIGLKTEESQSQDFPIIIKNEQMVDFVTFSNNVGVLTKANVLIYSSNGKKTNNFLHGYTNPVIKESNKRVMTYDRGGNKLRVDSASASIGEIQTKFSILTAQISKSGNVAVVTSHDRYPCEVQVYDNNLKNVIYRYYSTEELSAIEFAHDEQTLIGSAITTINGILSAHLYKLSIKEEVLADIVVIKDILPLAICVNEENNIKVLGKDVIVSINTQTNEQKRYEYQGDLQYFVNSSSKETVLVNKNILSGYSVVSVISPDGSELASANINGDIIDIYSDGSRITVLMKSKVSCYDMKLKELNSYTLERSMNKVVYSGTDMYVLGADNILKFVID